MEKSWKVKKGEECRDKIRDLVWRLPLSLVLWKCEFVMTIQSCFSWYYLCDDDHYAYLAHNTATLYTQNNHICPWQIKSCHVSGYWFCLSSFFHNFFSNFILFCFVSAGYYYLWYLWTLVCACYANSPRKDHLI